MTISHLDLDQSRLFTKEITQNPLRLESFMGESCPPLITLSARVGQTPSLVILEKY